MPIAAGDGAVAGPGTGAPGHGGFITLAGTFTNDPLSNGGYSHQLSRWVPVAYADISPDGQRYAYSDSATAGPPDYIHVVTISTGVDHPVQTAAPSSVLAFTAAGVYFASVQPSAASTGLSLINPDTGAVTQITDKLVWGLVTDKVAYAVDTDPADPNPPAPLSPGATAGDRVEKLDLATGNITPLLTINGAYVIVEGVDSAQNPIVGADIPGSGFKIRLLPSNQEIFSGPSLRTSSSDSDPTSALSDSTGTWFASPSGAISHLASGDSSLKKVATTSVEFPTIAGPCV